MELHGQPIRVNAFRSKLIIITIQTSTRRQKVFQIFFRRRKALDDAAASAVRDSAPFDPLPESFNGPSIELRLRFFYNLPPSALNP
jgi:hypothetical protein